MTVRLENVPVVAVRVRTVMLSFAPTEVGLLRRAIAIPHEATMPTATRAEVMRNLSMNFSFPVIFYIKLLKCLCDSKI